MIVPDNPRSWHPGGGLTTWLLSAVLHFAVLTGIGLSIPAMPQGAADEATREGGIVLVSRTAGNADYFADENRGHIALTAYEVGEAPEAPQPLNSLPQPPLNPMQPSASNVPANSGEGGPVGQGPGKAIETQVFGVRGKGTRFVYVFDRSSSMEGAPLLAAQHELIASLQSLQSVHQFQIIFYNQEPQLMPQFRGQSPRMVSADEPGKRLAASFIGGISAYGATEHVPALRMALHMRPDVIFFLTDANEPQLRADELRQLRQLNRGTSINAIEFGIGPPQPRYNFLQQLAAENGGRHTYVDVTRLGR